MRIVKKLLKKVPAEEISSENVKTSVLSEEVEVTNSEPLERNDELKKKLKVMKMGKRRTVIVGQEKNTIKSR